jgi:Tol biopolymer transport system component
MADLKIALDELRDELTPAEEQSAPLNWWRKTSTRVGGAALIVLVIGVLAFNAWRTSRAAREPGARPFLTRLTSDVGWTDYPAISRDGKLLAYASDRAGQGNLDIWVQQIANGSPARLTRDPGDEVDPSFSADGSRVAFHSSRSGGGVYVISTLGGEERLLAKGGYSPRFSPDGAWIAYGIAEPPGSRIDVAPAAGGPATSVTPGFYRAQGPAWAADGKHLLFWGQRDRNAAPEGNVDWYVTSVPAGPVIRTDARQVLVREGFEGFYGLPLPDAWASGGNRVLFHGHVGDASNVWQLPLAPGSWRASVPQRTTFGTTDEAAASVTSDGQLVFISRTMNADIWSLPIDSERGRVQGVLNRVTEDAADDYDPTLSADGLTLVFRSRRAGRFEVVSRNLGNGTETVLTQAATDHYPAVSFDGTKVAYSVRRDGRMPVFVVSVTGGPPQEVCADCGEVEQWARHGEILYATSDDPSSVGLLKLGSRPDRGWLKHRGYGIYNPRLSADGHWVVFNARPDRFAPARIVIAAVLDSVVARENEWIVVIDDGEAPAWSPSGHVLYFWSDRDGSPCLWAQRLDPSTKHPAGPPVNIQHFHTRGRTWKNLYVGAPDLAVAPDRIVLNLGEHTGNVWMTDLPR